MPREPLEIDLSLPDTFVVVIPNPRAKVFGRESTAGPLACYINYRANTLERDLIAEAAQRCGVTSSTFMRSIVMQMTQQVVKHCKSEQSLA